jgi:hypothetical protein
MKSIRSLSKTKPYAGKSSKTDEYRPSRMD